jgi:hypothetical protein
VTHLVHQLVRLAHHPSLRERQLLDLRLRERHVAQCVQLPPPHPHITESGGGTEAEARETPAMRFRRELAVASVLALGDPYLLHRGLLEVEQDELAAVPQLVDEVAVGGQALHGQVEVLPRCVSGHQGEPQRVATDLVDHLRCVPRRSA